MDNIENEIEVLESALSNLTEAMNDCLESPYHKFLANNLETDIEEINDRLHELYDIQDRYWAEELKQQNYEFESGRL